MATKSLDQSIVLVEQLTKHARSSWIALMGFLGFAGVTLLGVEDKDFFAYGVETRLPLIGVSIPTAAFFWAAPLLATMLYIHLHLYLIRLYDKVMGLPAVIDSQPIGDKIYPWLVTDWVIAKHFDRRSELPLRWISRMLSPVMVFMLGPVVLFGFWWKSMVKHDLALTLFLGVLFYIVMYVGYHGFQHLSVAQHRTPRRSFRSASFVILAIGLIWVSSERSKFGMLPDVSPLSQVDDDETDNSGEVWSKAYGVIRIPMARADLTGAHLSVMPADWVGYSLARADYLYEFKKRHSLEAEADLDSILNSNFEKDWKARRMEYLEKIATPDLKGADLRGAILTNAFLVGSDLSMADFSNATLYSTNLEGANLNHAQLFRANLGSANLASADFNSAHLKSAYLNGSNMEGASFTHGHLEGADLIGAYLRNTDFNRAHLEGAILHNAHMEGATFTQAHLEGADLSTSRLYGVNFNRAHLEGANLISARLWKIEGLLQEQLNSAIGNSQTKLPDGLSIPSCWKELPKLPDGEPVPANWINGWFISNIFCPDGEEPVWYPILEEQEDIINRPTPKP